LTAAPVAIRQRTTPNATVITATITIRSRQPLPTPPLPPSSAINNNTTLHLTAAVVVVVVSIRRPLKRLRICQLPLPHLLLLWMLISQLPPTPKDLLPLTVVVGSSLGSASVLDAAMWTAIGTLDLTPDRQGAAEDRRREKKARIVSNKSR
jgi:hypothetical protein